MKGGAPNEACLHKRVTHRHGTNVCYHLDGCHCDECRAAARLYERRRRRWTGEYPQQETPLVDPSHAVTHTKDLIRRGMGYERVAAAAGIAGSQLGALLWGRRDRPTRRIRRTTEARILAVELNLADGAKVPAEEAKAIIAELVARGWTKKAIARALGNPAAVSLQVGATATIQAGNLRRLRRLLDEPVPLRLHPLGSWYQPNPGYVRQTVKPSTPGVPGLLCDVCGEPLRFHKATNPCRR